MHTDTYIYIYIYMCIYAIKFTHPIFIYNYVV